MAFKCTEEQLNKLDKDLLVQLFLGMQEQMEKLTEQTQALNDKMQLFHETDPGALPGRRKTIRSFIERTSCPAVAGGKTTGGCLLCVPETEGN